MLRQLRARIGSAHVIALIALFVSASGVGYAAARIGTADIKNGAVTNKKLDDNAVTTGKIKDGSVTSTKIANGQVRAADLGPTIVVTKQSGTIPDNDNGTVDAPCPAGSKVISGGGEPSVFGVQMVTSIPKDNGWRYQGRNLSGVPATMSAYAMCLKG